MPILALFSQQGAAKILCKLVAMHRGILNTMLLKAMVLCWGVFCRKVLLLSQSAVMECYTCDVAFNVYFRHLPSNAVGQ